jgi:hypothetical protein
MLATLRRAYDNSSLCSLLSALCSLLSALCSLLSALCLRSVLPAKGSQAPERAHASTERMSDNRQLPPALTNPYAKSRVAVVLASG